MPKKRVAVISDPHPGHRVGLTPPEWQWQLHGTNTTTQHNKWALLQQSLWKRYKTAIDQYKPYDILLHIGDGVDGKGSKSGGTEQITSDRNEQAEMGARIILEAEAPVVRMAYGTGYHTGINEDWENAIVDKVRIKDPHIDIKIGSHEWLDVNGVIFDIKHFTGATSIPHSKGTSLSKEWLWNALWAEQGLQPRADIYIRGHVHYAFQCGEPGSWYAMTCPALQGMGSKFGSRMCRGLVHFGIVVFDITETGAWIPHWDIIKIKEQETKAEIL